MSTVATEANVSRVTVYDHFESKAGLLEALAWWTFAQHDIDRIRRARLQPDVRLALVDFIGENARFYSSFGTEGRAVLKSATVDPDLAAVIDITYIGARRTAIGELIDRLDDAGELSSNWSPIQAVDVLMVITSLESFETLAVHRSLTIEETAGVLANMACVLLTPQ